MLKKWFLIFIWFAKNFGIIAGFRWGTCLTMYSGPNIMIGVVSAHESSTKFSWYYDKKVRILALASSAL